MPVLDAAEGGAFSVLVVVVVEMRDCEERLSEAGVMDWPSIPSSPKDDRLEEAFIWLTDDVVLTIRHSDD